MLTILSAPSVSYPFVAVPDFQTIMRPALVALDGDKPVPVQEIRSSVATALNVSDEDLAEMLGSGRVTRFANRVGWALTHMSKAMLVQRPSRAYYAITDRGREVLKANLDKVDMNVLLTFPEYQEFRTPKAVADAEVVTADEASVSAATELSHEEALSNIIEIAHKDLSQDILTAILEQPPVFLERLALRLLAAMGYGGREALTEHTGKPGDAGLDGLIRQDALGLELVGVQAKRYDRGSSVNRPEIQAFVGALQGAQTSRGVFVTTAKFSAGARQFADNVPMRLVLLDGSELARAMILYNVGVSIRETFELKQIADNFIEE